eukprot:jgi/Psemu1/178900/e_gw1.6.32.1
MANKNDDCLFYGNDVVGGVPSVAIRWMISNTFTNVELAVLSNVSRGWREVVAHCIVDAASEERDKEKEPPSREEEEKEELQKQDETYCVAWFHPDGIKFEQLSIVKPGSETCDGPQPGHGAPTNGGTGEATDPSVSDHKFLFTKNHSQLNQSSAAMSRPESCPASDNIMDWGASVLYQWNVLEKTQGKFIGSTSNPQPAGSENVDKTVRLPSSSPWVFSTRCNDSTYSSCAVRGAVFARPEGYCQCWDKDPYDPSEARDEVWKKHRSRRKREFQREVRTHDNEGANEAGGILRPCIQFLNIDSTNAVRLFTPKFEKPIFTPLTIFCVAIATEDGCFFSGLEQRFEMGHMHPTQHNTEINDERSPICLNAEYTDRKVSTAKCKEKDSDDASVGCEDPSCKCFFPSTNEDEYNDEDFGDYFQSINEDGCGGSTNDDDDDDECAHVVRGHFGPGMWHCYAAVFDGERSAIRIDGVEESTHGASTIPSSFRACLDGITIGSDHVYDMTLCFGEGSDGEGEGAISELVFFKGHLQAADIESLESHLMAKHGIPKPFKSRNERVNDDYYSRLAHSLMDEAPSTGVNRKRKQGEDVKAKSVPLRYMTKLRQVAWEQIDKVTGRPRAIRRIGASLRKGSVSEW